MQTIEHTTTETSRARWMAGEGRRIYEPWATEIINQSLEQIPELALRPDIARSYYQGPTRYAHAVAEAVTTSEACKDLTATMLLPRSSALQDYTSCNIFQEASQSVHEVATTPEEAIIIHARDSLTSGMVIPTFVAHATWLKMTSYRARKESGTLDSTSHRTAVTEAAAFVMGALTSETFTHSMQTMASTGFGVLAVKFMPEMDLFDTGELSIAAAHSLPLPSTGSLPSHMLTVHPNSRGEMTTDYTLHPDMARSLRQALKNQNTSGLTREQALATPLDSELPISSGCPVKRGPVIPATCAFMSEIIRAQMQA